MRQFWPSSFKQTSKAVKIVSLSNYYLHSSDLRNELGWQRLKKQIEIVQLFQVHTNSMVIQIHSQPMN